MMQSNSTGQTYIYETNFNKLGTVHNIPLEQTFRFLYIQNSFFLLQSKGLIKLDYDNSTLNLSLNSMVQILPYNTYKLLFNYYFPNNNVFYIPNLPYIYKAGECLGQSKLVNMSCIEYNCSVGNCSYCPISPFVCSICINSFVLNSKFSC